MSTNAARREAEQPSSKYAWIDAKPGRREQIAREWGWPADEIEERLEADERHRVWLNERIAYLGRDGL